MSLFLITTGRNDRFQGLEFRLNVDPGAKYLFVNTDPTTFWGEVGYDFQYDIRNSDALAQKTFRYSIVYLAFLFTALLVDHYL